MLQSYNGYPASPDPNLIGVKPFSVAGHSFPGGVKAGPVATVFRYYLAQYHLRVESLGLGTSSDEWGYSYRKNRNANNLSCHASGTAVDANATRHPNGKRNTLSPTQVATLRVLLKEVGNVIRWGGDFTGIPDEMHHEVHATPAQVKAVADRLLNPAWFRRDLTVGSKGDDVKHVQARLKVKADGIYGPITRDAVKRLEGRLMLPVTGKVTKSRAFHIG